MSDNDAIQPTNHSGMMLDPAGNMDAVAKGNSAPMAQSSASVPNLAISNSGGQAQLSWTHLGTVVDHYEVWTNTYPYFTPGDVTSIKLGDVFGPFSGTESFTDPLSTIGNPNLNRYYVVRAVFTTGLLSPVSNRVGEFDFALVPGGGSGSDTFSVISLPLDVTAQIPNADTLATYIGAGVTQVLHWNAQFQTFEYWLPQYAFGTNFNLAVGQVYWIALDSTGGSMVSFEGAVPPSGSLHFNMLGNSSACLFNEFSLPFDQSGITTASNLSTALGAGNVEQTLSWDAPFQTYEYWFPGINFGTDFTTRAGYPYHACLKANTSWPCPNCRQLGVTQLISGPVACSGQNCYQLQVTCPELSQPDVATLKIGDPISSTLQGTILFLTGWTGSYFWDGTSLSQSELANMAQQGFIIPQQALTSNASIINDLRLAGFRTVMVKWNNNWFQSEFGYPDGMGNLACRPATVAQWVYDNIHGQNQNLPYCATGHSNGASQLGYTLAEYGLSHLFSSAVFESGPNWSRVDTACLHNDPANPLMDGDIGERSTIDWAFGYNNDGTGPCAKMDVTFNPNFQEASLGLGSWDYIYPKMMVSFVFGGADTSSTAYQGMYYHDLLVNDGTPLINMTVVPGATHFVSETPEGTQAMESTILNECHLH